MTPTTRAAVLLASSLALAPCVAAETASKHGVTVSVPEGWSLDSRRSDQGPLSLDNFSAQYLRGGLVPMGGADINISRKPVPEGTLDEIVEIETRRDRYFAKTTETVDGSPAIRVSYGAEIWPDYEESDLVVFVARAGHLYRFTLTYNTRDDGKSRHIAAFNTVVRSAKFAE